MFRPSTLSVPIVSLPKVFLKIQYYNMFNSEAMKSVLLFLFSTAKEKLSQKSFLEFTFTGKKKKGARQQNERNREMQTKSQNRFSLHRKK